jgi:hypothetical protein
LDARVRITVVVSPLLRGIAKVIDLVVRVEATLVVRQAPGTVSWKVPVAFAFGSAASMRMVLASVIVA